MIWVSKFQTKWCLQSSVTPQLLIPYLKINLHFKNFQTYTKLNVRVAMNCATTNWFSINEKRLFRNNITQQNGLPSGSIKIEDMSGFQTSMWRAIRLHFPPIYCACRLLFALLYWHDTTKTAVITRRPALVTASDTHNRPWWDPDHPAPTPHARSFYTFVVI